MNDLPITMKCSYSRIHNIAYRYCTEIWLLNLDIYQNQFIRFLLSIYSKKACKIPFYNLYNRTF